MPSKLFTDWLESVPSTVTDVPLYKECANGRVAGLNELKKLLVDHFVGEETVLKAGGYLKAAKTILNSLPTTKRTQSGDLGELIATEYVDAQTPFRVPIRKLRWKSDRKMPMHGNDVIAVERRGGKVRVLKGESKSAGAVSAATVDGAAKGLDSDDGRPNPSTLAFIAKRLYEAGRDAEGKVFEDLQADGAMAARDVQHLIFSIRSGNRVVTKYGGLPQARLHGRASAKIGEAGAGRARGVGEACRAVARQRADYGRVRG